MSEAIALKRGSFHLLADEPVGGCFLGVPGVQQLFGHLAQLLGISGGIDGPAEPLDFELLAGAEFDRGMHGCGLLQWRQPIGAIAAGRARRYRTAAGSVFQLVTTLTLIRISKDPHQQILLIPMRLSWPQHLQTARLLESAADGQRGTALALMGVSLLILAEDLLASELARSSRQTRC